MTTERRGGPTLTASDITKLCDAAMTAFSQWHQIELRAMRAAKLRLAAELRRVDVFGPALHYATHEDYTPTGDRGE